MMYETETIPFLAPKIWVKVPQNTKTVPLFHHLKWISENRNLVDLVNVFWNMLVLYKKLQNTSFVTFLRLTHFGSMSRERLRILCFEAHIMKWLVFPWDAGLRLTLDFVGKLAKIGLMYMLVLLIYCISKDAIQSWGVEERQFWEYNYKL